MTTKQTTFAFQYVWHMRTDGMYLADNSAGALSLNVYFMTKVMQIHCCGGSIDVVENRNTRKLTESVGRMNSTSKTRKYRSTAVFLPHFVVVVAFKCDQYLSFNAFTCTLFGFSSYFVY